MIPGPPLKLQNRFDLLSQADERASGPVSSQPVPGSVESEPWPSSRAPSTSARQRLLRDAARRHSGSHHCPAREFASEGAGTTASPPVSSGSPASPPVGTQTSTSAQWQKDRAPAPAPLLPARHPELSVERIPAPDSDATGSAHLPPRPLFSPTTLIVGDSIIRNVRFFSATTRRFPGATVAVIMEKNSMNCSSPCHPP